ncbi:hypothetical protein [Pseudodesulfovibrio portus]|uniref:Uncharacterized protein n=1 Tax=Pseudodesulfovibrio portus TaxID=231439 RepID=A0ABM8AVV3_9BACT|nr:hypothetical protein [Pseudodesulfovibrio portus]BDQ35392.1 hypothetical protein JCM14722_29340 [Pseudodesulfovibrio portus]
MKRFFPLVLIVLLSLCAVAQAAETVPSFIHFVVVDSVLPDGTDSADAIRVFEKEVIAMASGFTELGDSRGGSLVNGAVEYQNNISFVIAADKDISKELKALSIRLFGGRGAFVLAWPGTMVH